MNLKKCHCGALQEFEKCCEPILKNTIKAANAEELMRSRYSAYVTHNATYLLATTVSCDRAVHSFDAILHWAKANTWLELVIIEATYNFVEFKAYYIDAYKKKHIHHERSTFVLENKEWFYVNGVLFN